MTSLYYIEFIDDTGREEAVTVQASSERAAREAIGPREITRLVRLPGPRKEPIEYNPETEPWTLW